MDEQGKCIICSIELLPSRDSTLLKETTPNVLTELFQVLCHYLEWTPSPETSLTFDSQGDPFPFCQLCAPEIVTLRTLHEDVQRISERIQKITGCLTSRILESFSLNETLNDVAESEVIQTGTGLTEDSVVGKTFDRSKRFRYYRSLTRKRFEVSVRISSKDRQACLKRIKSKRNKVVSMDQESKFVPNVGTVCEIVHSDDDASQEFEVMDYDPNYSDFVISEEETKPSSFIATSSCKRKRNFTVPKSKPSFKVVPSLGCASGSFANTKYYERVNQVSDNRFSFDSKRFFECVDGNEWKCLECGLQSLSKMHFIEHYLRRKTPCLGKAPDVCLKEFTFQGVAYDQLAEELFECRICPFQGKNNDELEGHVERDHQEVPGSRRIRETSWIRVGPYSLKLKNHVVTEFTKAKRKQYQCTLCKTTTNRLTVMRNHLRKEHATVHRNRITKVAPDKFVAASTDKEVTFEFHDQRFTCVECHYQCEAYENMLLHLRTSHTGKIEHMCEFCGKTFKKAAVLQNHIQQNHADGPKFPCDQCDKSYKLQVTLNLHKRQFHSEKHLMCDLCGKTFSSPCFLNTHKRRMHEETPCSVCGKIYPTYSLKSHMDSHSQEKSYECQVCHKKFKHLPSLYTHRPSCGGKKPFSCEICGLQFTQIHSVRKHQRSKHGDIVSSGVIAKNSNIIKRRKRKNNAEEANTGNDNRLNTADVPQLSQIVEYPEHTRLMSVDGHHQESESINDPLVLF